jgi:hypothetical protein
MQAHADEFGRDLDRRDNQFEHSLNELSRWHIREDARCIHMWVGDLSGEADCRDRVQAAYDEASEKLRAWSREQGQQAVEREDARIRREFAR